MSRNRPSIFVSVLGYDAQSDEVLYHDPAQARGAYLRMSRAKFLRLWPLKSDGQKWTVVRLRLEPDQLIHPARRAERLSSADYAQHIRKLKTRIPDGFTVVLERPFVVVGNESPETVRSRAKNTVDWAVSRLKRDYFARNPSEIIDIWLFEDSVSYEEYTQRLFGEKPTTPYGFYSPRHHALIMNIATGGGTLVHEIVHPFMASNFPDCPSWFNEGLASLYEQAQDRDGHIAGLTNWRLRGLKAAIHDGEVPSFEKLCGTTTARVLRSRPRDELRPGALPLLLPAGARPVGQVLSCVPSQCRDRSDRNRDAQVGPRRGQSRRVSAAVGEIRAQVGIRTLSASLDVRVNRRDTDPSNHVVPALFTFEAFGVARTDRAHVSF